MSDFALEQQEKNDEMIALEESSPSFRGLHDELDRRTEEKYQTWKAYFDSRPGAPKMFARETDHNWNTEKEAQLWKEYQEAHKQEQKALWDDMDKKLRDPNDHVETSERTDPTEVYEQEHRECYGLN